MLNYGRHALLQMLTSMVHSSDLGRNGQGRGRANLSSYPLGEVFRFPGRPLLWDPQYSIPGRNAGYELIQGVDGMSRHGCSTLTRQ